MIKEFREFAVRGNVVDMAVGIIIGAAFTSIVSSLVKDIIMPPIGWLTGDMDFAELFIVLRPGTEVPPPYASVDAAQAAGAVTMNYGLFVNAVVQFLLVAVATFFLVRTINRLRREEEQAAEADRICPYCRQVVHAEATRCPACTSEISP